MAITRLNNNSITSVTALPSGVATGKIGQIIMVEQPATVDIASTSYVDISGLSVSITPTSTSSKIFISVYMNPSHSVGGSFHFVKLLRDSTAISIGQSAGAVLEIELLLVDIIHTDLIIWV